MFLWVLSTKRENPLTSQSEVQLYWKICWHNLCIRFGTCELRRMNRSQSFAVLDKLSRIEPQSWPKYKSAVPNWFTVRRTLHVPDLIIRFGSCKVWRLNWALNRVLSVSHLFTPPPRGSQPRKVYCGGGGGQRQSAVILDCQYV